MRKHLLPLLLLLAAVWFLYFQTGSFEFLRLDDHDYTFRCAFVKDGLSLGNLVEALTNPRHAAIWMPVTYISYMADISLFGPGMGPHHLVNVLIHSLNTGLLYVFLILVLGSRQADSGPNNERTPWMSTVLPFFATALWALHPQRAEAVAWIAGRKELLCTFFTLLGLIFWIRPNRSGRFAAYLCCALACMSKPTAMCFPFLAFAVERLGGGRWVGGVEVEGDNKRTTTSWWAYAPFLIMAVGTGALAIYSQTHPEGRAELELFTASFPWRILNATVSLGLYIFQTIIPIGVHLDYRSTPGAFPIDGMLGLTSFAVAFGVLAAGWMMVRRNQEARRTVVRTALPLILFFLAALAPTLGIFGSFGEHARADRFLYLPAMVFPLALVLSVRISPKWLIPSGTILACIYLFASFPVVAAYKNDYTAFSRTLQFDPENGRALAHVASEECARFGHIDKGITLYRKSQELRPRDDTAAQLAYTLSLRGLSSDTAEIRRLCARFACDHSLDRKGMALEALGTTAMRQRRWQEALSCLEDSIKAPLRFYSAEDAKLRLGACYCNAKRPEDAIRVLEPLVKSPRTDIAKRAQQFIGMIRKNPKSVILF